MEQDVTRAPQCDIKAIPQHRVVFNEENVLLHRKGSCVATAGVVPRAAGLCQCSCGQLHDGRKWISSGSASSEPTILSRSSTSTGFSMSAAASAMSEAAPLWDRWAMMRMGTPG